MKIFLALLISCLTLSAATTYPVLTDSANRTFPGGVTNVFFLNSNVVTTGTMRATGVLTLTNASNVFAGDGSGLTGISAGVSTSGGNATNLQVYSSGGTNSPFRFMQGGVDQISIQTNSATGNDYSPWRLVFTNQASVGWNDAVVGVTFRNAANNSYVALYGAAFYGGTLGVHDLGLVGDTVYLVDDGYSVAGAHLKSTAGLIWHSGAAGHGAGDTALHRVSAGLIEVNIGSAGSYGDIVSRSIYTTNLYATNLIINGGATVTKILSATATLNFDLTALTVEDLTITVTGAADGDVVTLGVPNGSVTTSVQYSAWVSAADTVTVRARTSAIGENPASGTFRATIFKH